MSRKRGLFIAFEGPDRVGKTTQVNILTEHIKSLSKYNDVAQTHEPWKNEEIKRKLKEDKDAYSDGERFAELYVDDRVRHTKELIRPFISAGGIVICDRYKMSTCAYQWAQGVSLPNLLQLHEDRGILTPDLTFCFDAPLDIILERGNKRLMQYVDNKVTSNQEVEKFERDNSFSQKVIEAYRSLSHMAQVDERIFGRVVQINANKSVEDISKQIRDTFDVLYSAWKDESYVVDKK